MKKIKPTASNGMHMAIDHCGNADHVHQWRMEHSTSSSIRDETEFSVYFANVILPAWANWPEFGNNILALIYKLIAV